MIERTRATSSVICSCFPIETRALDGLKVNTSFSRRENALMVSLAIIHVWVLFCSSNSFTCAIHFMPVAAKTFGKILTLSLLALLRVPSKARIHFSSSSYLVPCRHYLCVLMVNHWLRVLVPVWCYVGLSFVCDSRYLHKSDSCQGLQNGSHSQIMYNIARHCTFKVTQYRM